MVQLMPRECLEMSHILMNYLTLEKTLASGERVPVLGRAPPGPVSERSFAGEGI
jgi:hypothetical protein